MRLAILIGISTYEELNDLPACERDVDAMHELLLSTGHYPDHNILKISGSEKANNIKEKIIAFLNNYNDQEISEVFFYYSGHGLYREDELYYLMSDYKETSLRQTSIENSEVDSWLRNLKPEITTKVVDTCYAGLQYIKNDQVVMKNTNNFKKCYFFLSSQVDQKSYTSEGLSDFTKSFIVGIKNCPQGKVRYKQIMDAISDHFEMEGKQKPQFIFQAPMTEVFCNLDSELQKSIEQILINHTPNLNAVTPISEVTSIRPRQTLKELIEEDAKNCLSRDEVRDILSKLQTQLNTQSFPEDLKEFFDFSTEFIKIDYDFETYSLPSPDVIGRWLNSKGKSYFAEPVWKETEEPLSPYNVFFNPLIRTRTKNEIADFKITSNLDYDIVKVSATSKYPNVESYELTIVIILSKRSLQIFYYLSNLIDKNWHDKELPEVIKWKTTGWNLGDSTTILDAFKALLSRFTENIRNQLEQRFMLATGASSGAGDTNKPSN